MLGCNDVLFFTDFRLSILNYLTHFSTHTFLFAKVNLFLQIRNNIKTMIKRMTPSWQEKSAAEQYESLYFTHETHKLDPGEGVGRSAVVSVKWVQLVKTLTV